MVMLVLLGGLYFIFMRPQQVQQKRQTEFVSQIKLGEEVYTFSGICGKIVALNDTTVVLETENGAEIRMVRAVVAGYTEALNNQEATPKIAQTQDKPSNENS